MRLPWQLLLIFAIFATLCVLYNKKTPYRQAGFYTATQSTIPDIGAPDERQHANYVNYLIQGPKLLGEYGLSEEQIKERINKGGQFPIIVPGSPDLGEMYQAHQPPLYYLTAKVWSSILNIDPTKENDGFKLRLLNLFFGLIMLAGVYQAIIWGTGREDFALCATAFCALLPMSVALHSAVSNDPMLYAICAWVIAFCSKAVVSGWDIKSLLVTGVLIGLGLITKTTALALFPIVLLVIFFSWRTARQEEPSLFLQSGLLLALPLLIASFWLYRNVQLYGDPFALGVFEDAFTGSPKAETFIYRVGAGTYWMNMVLWLTSMSFVGVFGYMDIFLLESSGAEASQAVYKAVIVLIAILSLIWVPLWKKLADVSDEISAPSPKRFVVINAIFIFVVTILFIKFNMTYFQAQARYLYPALVSFGAFFAMGLCTLLGQKRQYGWLATSLILGIINILALNTITTGFALRLQG